MMWCLPWAQFSNQDEIIILNDITRHQVEQGVNVWIIRHTDMSNTTHIRLKAYE